MPKLLHHQTAFNGGELAPAVFGRTDLNKYDAACETMENFVAHPEGNCLHRSGTRFVIEQDDSSKQARLIPFIFSTTESYMLLFEENQIWFFRDEGVIAAPTWTFVDGDVDVANDEIDITSHYYVDEQGPFRLTTTGTLPAGLSLATDYYIVDAAAGTPAHSFSLSLTAGGAIVDITGAAGGGTHTIAPSGTVPHELVTTYSESEIQDIRFAQSADILYIVHKDHAPAELTRTGHQAWTLADVAFFDGPYLPGNITSTTITASAVTGSITITASSTTGINDGQGFLAQDVGRHIRKVDIWGDLWGWAEITGITSTTIVTADVKGRFNSAGAVDSWHLGAYYANNYPTSVSFFEQRLGFAGPPNEPQRLDGSVISDFVRFSPTGADEPKVDDAVGGNPGYPVSSDITDEAAISYTLGANQVNAIRWINSSRTLLLGTTGATWTMQASSLVESLTPTNVQTRRTNIAGASSVAPVNVEDAVIFLSRSSRKVFALAYNFDRDAYVPENLTLIAEHVTEGGITDMAYQHEPNSIIWCVRNDGTLASLTLAPDQKVAAWHRHILGGAFGGGQAVVESVAVIPGPAEDEDQVWVIVKRTINGGTVRYVEFLEEDFYPHAAGDLDDAFFIDSGLSLDNPITITGITTDAPGEFTATSHGLSLNDEVRITHVVGMTEVNRNTYIVSTVKDVNTIELSDESGELDTTNFTEYVSGGEMRKLVSTVSGLDHLEGETVQVVGDGSPQSDQTVSSGSITLESDASHVHVGLYRNAIWKSLPVEAKTDEAVSLGHMRRIPRLKLRLHNTLGGEVCTGGTTYAALVYGKEGDPMGQPPSIFTGVKEISLDCGHSNDPQITIRQTQPLPMNLLALEASLELAPR